MFSLRLKSLAGLPALRSLFGSKQRLSYSSSPRCCFMMGEFGVIDIEGDMFVDAQEHFTTNPFLSPIPTDRVVGAFNPARPYHLLDAARHFMFSGALSVYMTHKSGQHIENPFVKGNVGVHRDLGLVVFKDISEMDGEMTQPLYHCLSDFLMSMVADSNISLSQHPKDLAAFLVDLKNPLVDEHSILQHPTLFSDDLYADICVEVYRVLCYQAELHEVPKSVVDHIFYSIGKTNSDVVHVCLGHGLFPQFMPKIQAQGSNQLAMASSISTYADFDLGNFIVRLHRHGAIHPVEPKVLSRVESNFPNFKFPLNREDVLRAYRIQFSCYLRDVFKAFEDARVAHMLKTAVSYDIYKDLRVSDRLPIPDIYRAKPAIFDKVSDFFIIINSF